MHRFFVPEEQFTDTEVKLVGEQAHQIRDVLRMQRGAHIVVLDNLGWEYEVALNNVARKQVQAMILERREATGEPHTKLTLYQSLLPRAKFEWVLQKCTEVGVSNFIPVITQRSLIQDTAVALKKMERWERIITEAAEQSGRARIPTLADPIQLHAAVSDLKAYQRSLIAWEQREGTDIRTSLRESEEGPAAVALFIGPEGGFAEEEVAWSRSAGVTPVTLGQRILRTETAAIVASALILYELGNFH
jgi:16S rRNA (uracil1498-N3)-methyltransferase